MSADNPDNDECEGDGHQINTEGKVVGEVNEPDAGSGGELELDKESLVKQKDSRGRAVLKDKQERSIFQYRWDEMFARLLEFKVCIILSVLLFDRLTYNLKIVCRYISHRLAAAKTINRKARERSLSRT